MRIILAALVLWLIPLIGVEVQEDESQHRREQDHGQQSGRRGPLQHLSGIQYYFDTDVRIWRGHTQYLDSEWGLTSIAQSLFRLAVGGEQRAVTVTVFAFRSPGDGGHVLRL